MTTAAEIAARYGATVAPGCVVRECAAGETSEIAVDYRYSSRTGRIDAVTPAMEKRAKFMTPERAAAICERRAHVAAMAAEGKAQREIAAALGVSRHTVHNDLTTLKLSGAKVTSRAASKASSNRDDLRDAAQVLRAFWFPVAKTAKPLSSAELCRRLNIARMRDISGTIDRMIERGLITVTRVDLMNVYEVTERGNGLLRRAAQ